MSELVLPNGDVCLIDADDLERGKHIKWYTNRGKYVIASVYENGKQKNIQLGRFILEPLDGLLVDHINGNPLDNRRCNLRAVTPSQNMMNKKKKCNNLSGFKGVSRHSKNSWRATIRVNKVNIHIGSFSSPELAYEAYKKKAIECFGEFACFR